MKKYFVLCIALLMIFFAISLTGCDNDGNGDNSTSNDTTVDQNNGITGIPTGDNELPSIPLE